MRPRPRVKYIVAFFILATSLSLNLYSYWVFDYTNTTVTLFSATETLDSHPPQHHEHSPQFDGAASQNDLNKVNNNEVIDVKSKHSSFDNAIEIEQAPLPQPRINEHIVFIGDSVLRYSYLEWLDLIHFSRNAEVYSSDMLINEKLSPSWHSFFTNTTEHFKGSMLCDCRRSENWDLGSEVENRYYRSDQLWATYIQGYGDNMAHGRYAPEETHLAKISMADGPDKDESGCKWGYLGDNWDKLISEHVSKFTRKPTAIVFNAGMWPNEGIALKLGSIFHAARDAMGYKGRVIWRATTKSRDDLVAHNSPADIAAKDWSYRLPFLTYQAFPELNISASDYFDGNHFGNSRVYREWNVDLSRALAVRSRTYHRVFILVGAVRTLHKTEESILRNMVYPICAPPSCVAHLVIHFSYADNRPSAENHDGDVISAGEDQKQHSFFNQTDWPEGYLVLHKVNGYEIGSQKEQDAMDIMERKEPDPIVAKRMRMFRVGDPRRYSMWFARAWAWRHVQQLHKSLNFDFFAFGRPDLLWLLPAPTISFFEDFRSGDNVVWAHDTYFSATPDTLAFIQSYDSAHKYFALSSLLKEDVACLGGPDFNRSLTSSRLLNANISTTDTDFCSDDSLGWSESILMRKLRNNGLEDRYFPAASVLVRPPQDPLCWSIAPYFTFYWVKHIPTNVSHVACLAANTMIENGKSNNEVLNSRPFLLRGKAREQASTCLTLSTLNQTLTQMPCQIHVPPEQLFVNILGINNSITMFGYDGSALITLNETLADLENSWVAEPAELYSKNTFDLRETV